MVAPDGYDKVDKQVDKDTTNVDTDNKTHNKEIDIAEMKIDDDKKSSDEEQEEPKPKDYFAMYLVNGYGSQILRNLNDDDTKLTLNS